MLAGLAGISAPSAVLVRDERRRRAYSSDDVRAGLHERHAALESTQPEERRRAAPAESSAGRRHRLARPRHRR